MSENHRILNSLRHQVWTMTDEHTYGLVNMAHAGFHRKTLEDLAGKPLNEALPPEAADALRRGFIGAFRADEPCETEEWVPDGAGEKRLLSIHSTPEKNSSGGIERVVCSAVDITRQRTAERALRESRERFDQLARQNRTVVWEVDREGMFTFVSPVVKDVLGYRPEELTGNLHFYDLHPEEEREAFKEFTLGVFNRREMFIGLVNTVLTRGRRRLTMSTNGIPLLNADGSLRGYRGSDTDITGRHRAEEALRKSEALYRATIDALNSSIHIIDSDYRIVMMNRTFSARCGELGLNPEAVGLKLSEQFPFLSEKVYNEYKRVFETREPLFTQDETELKGRVFATETSKIPITLGDGTPGVLTKITDITELRRAEEAHRAGESRYQELVDMVSDIIWRYETDSRGKFVSSTISSAADSMLGLPPGTVGHSFQRYFSHVHPEDLQKVKDTLFSSLRTRARNVSLEYRLVRGDGETIRVRSHGSVHPLPGGNSAAFGVTSDITGLKPKTVAFQENDGMHRLLFQNARYAVAVCEMVFDGKGRPVDYVFVDANPAFETHTGIPAERVVGRRASEVFSERPPLLAVYGRVVRTGLSAGFRHFLDPPGRHLEINAFAMGHDRFATMFSDVTEHEEMKKAFREREEVHRVLAQDLPDLVMRFDSGGRHLSVSGNAADAMGVDPSKMIGKTHRELGLPEEVCAFWEDALRHVFMTRQPLEKLFNPSAGGSATHNLRLIPEEGADGSVDSVVAISRDITTQIQDREAREKLQSELNQARKIESIGKLAGGVAHDFNNMLGVILGYAESALEQISSEHPLWPPLQEVRKAGERSVALTRQLLAFARQQVIEPGVVDLNHAVEAMLEMLRRLIGENIQLVWKPHEGLWPVLVDPAQVDQILVNLCLNGRDAICGQGRMIIETMNVTADEAYSTWHPGFPPGDYVLLAVSDDGCGMDREVISKLFQPFFTTKESDRGTGLGLATGYSIVRQNNGFINVYSEPGEGTMFKVYLPRHLGTKKQPEESPPELPEHGTETILVVEDEEPVLHLTVSMLESMGYRVLAAETTEKALEIAESLEEPLHLLLTDVVMPVMNGRDLARRIMSRFPDAVCLFMSGYSADVVTQQGMVKEGVNFLQKPFSKNNLSNAVRTVLDPPPRR